MMAGPQMTDHNPDLAHHFENMDQQRQSSRLGMWLFLVTEILFFGGLFCAYVVYRVKHPEVINFGQHYLDKSLGALNTVVLICSSLTMAWAVRAAQLKQRAILQLMLILSFVLAGTFLGVKYVEYSHKWHHGLLWASRYAPDAHILAEAGVEVAAGHAEEAVSEGAEGASVGETGLAAETVSIDEAAPEALLGEAGESDVSKIAPAAAGPAGLATAQDRAAAMAEGDPVIVDPANARTFFSVYFLMTGLHGIHVILGMLAMLWLLKLTRQGVFDGGHYTKVDNIALYWHVVDLIWIYLFLLMYLID
jgi:cytochrome c oxidase subunit 3